MISKNIENHVNWHFLDSLTDRQADRKTVKEKDREKKKKIFSPVLFSTR